MKAILKPTRKLNLSELKAFLDSKSEQFNQRSFIANDPISIPHQYSVRQDIEIAGLFAAVLAWGQRKTIIRKCNELLERMDHDPYAFIMNHKERDLAPFKDFKHRTFNGTDTLYFIASLRSLYQQHRTLEKAFAVSPGEQTIE